MKNLLNRTLCVLAVIALTAPAVTFSAQFQDSRTGVKRDIGLPSGIPLGATVYDADSSEVLKKDTRTRSCAQVYGAAPAGMSYTGGPWFEYRFEIGYERDGSGSYIDDGAGGFVKSYSTWERESGECHRNYDLTRNTRGCPANQQGEIIDRHRYTILDDDSIINDTGWVEISNTCAYYFVSNGTETQVRGCPAGMIGQYTDQRSFQNWSDGSRRNHTAWVLIGNTCNYYHVSNGYEDTTGTCPSGMTGYYLYRRTFQNWSDGSRRNYSGWSLIGNTCAYYHAYNSYEDTTSSCPAGYTGYILLRRTFQVWSDGSYRNYSGWYQAANYCTPAGCSPSYSSGSIYVPYSGSSGTTVPLKRGCLNETYMCVVSTWVIQSSYDSCGNGN